MYINKDDVKGRNLVHYRGLKDGCLRVGLIFFFFFSYLKRESDNRPVSRNKLV